MHKSLCLLISLIVTLSIANNDQLIFKQIREQYSLPDSILKQKELLTVKDKFGRTPFIYSVRMEKGDIANQLLKAGAPLEKETLLNTIIRERDVSLVEFILNTFPQIHNDSVRTELFKKCGRYYSTKKALFFRRGVSLTNDELYEFAYQVVSINDTLSLKAFVDKKYPLRISYAKGKRNYSIINALRDKRNQKMLDYYRETGVELTPNEKYYWLLKVVRTNDTVALKKVLHEEKLGVASPDTTRPHILYYAGYNNALHSFSYILNSFPCDSNDIMDGMIGLWTNTKRSPRKEELINQLWNYKPALNRLNYEPSQLSHYADYSSVREYITPFFKKGYGLNARGTGTGDTPLHNAASRYQDDGWLEQLLEWGADPNRENFSGETPLFSAVSPNNARMPKRIARIQKLIDAGCDINHKNSRGLPALYRGFPLDTSYQKPEIIECLLKNGADPNFANEKGASFILHQMHRSSSKYLGLFAPYFMHDSANFFGKTILHTAAELGRTDSMLTLLRYENMDLNRRCDQGLTALHYAAKNRRVSIEPLLVAGADPKVIESASWNTSLHLAVDVNNAEAVQFLLEAGADVHAKNKRGVTPVSLAAGSNSLEMLLLLKEYGADITEVDSLGNTLLMKAARQKRRDNVIAFLHWGLDPTERNSYGDSPYDLTEGSFLRDYPELKAILSGKKALPPIPNCSRTPYIGEWWLAEETLYDYHADSMVTFRYTEKESRRKIEVSHRIFNGSPYEIRDGKVLGRYGGSRFFRFEGDRLIYDKERRGREVYLKRTKKAQ